MGENAFACRAATLVSLMLLGAWAAGAQPVAETAADAVELLVEVWDEKGAVPADLSVTDLTVTEDGTDVPILALAPAGLTRPAGDSPPPRFVIYIDSVLTSSGTMRRATNALADLAQQLTEHGEVALVEAKPEPEILALTRDSLVLAERLSWMALNEAGGRRILGLREDTLKRLRPAQPPLSTAEQAEILHAAVDEEHELVNARQHRLLAWAGEQPDDRPRVLILVADGFDLEPAAFYRQHLDPTLVGDTLAESRLGDEASATAQALAAAGWTVLPVAIAPDTAGSGPARLNPIEVEGQDRNAVVPGVTLNPGRLLRRRGEKDEPAPAALVAPREPLTRLAAASGGEVITNETALRDVVSRLFGRFSLTYRSALAAEAGMRRLEVQALRPGLTVRTRRWVARATPAPFSAARLRKVLAGEEVDGGLDVAAVLRLDEEPTRPSSLEARVSLRALDDEVDDEGARTGLGATALRVTLGLAVPGQTPEVRQEVRSEQDLSTAAEWRYETALALPSAVEMVAVLIEDLDTGRWGGGLARVIQGTLAASDEELLPQPTVIEILRPEQQVLRGRVKLEAQVYDRQVDRVVFLLDERPVAEARQRPWSVRIDLGRTPRRQGLTAVAYDAAGSELGRDAVVLNAGSRGLAVEVVRPTSQQGTGAVQVEAAVSVPIERSLDRVLFFWNNEPVATLYAPPFRQQVYIPAEKPVGYIRVVGLLDDGSVAEDVLFMNGPVAGERVEVNLVELYVVVNDENGRPVRDLAKEDFRLLEDGEPQEIATFSDASDLPLTLGMAIDSSASMFVKLPRVQRAAVQFVESTFTELDRAFLVDFDTQPRLARGTTGRRDHIVQAIEGLQASGRTALWESIVFSLVQLQGVRGRKALVVFSDGADEDDQFPFRSCLRFARETGVPIYLILMKKEPRATLGLSLWARSFGARAERLVEAVGGRVFYASDYETIDEIYNEIEIELRSQYLLAYYPEDDGGEEAWRDVDIELAREGLQPRTLSGYRP